MLEEIFQKINQYKKNNLLIFLNITFINLCFGIYLIYRGIMHQEMTLFVVSFIFLLISDILVFIIVVIQNSKKINEIINEQLMPYMLRQINYDYQLTDVKFTKDEAMKSLMISRYGSFKSLNIVKGITNDIPYRFSYVTNYVSSGQSYQDVFSGTYISFTHTKIIDGIVQLRDKGRIEKNKKSGVVTHQYKGGISDRFRDIKFFTSQDLLGETLITEDLVRLYGILKNAYKKGVYVSITKHELIVGIHNRKNLFQLGLFKKINQDRVEKYLVEFRKIDRIICETSTYIKDNLVY